MKGLVLEAHQIPSFIPHYNQSSILAECTILIITSITYTHPKSGLHDIYRNIFKSVKGQRNRKREDRKNITYVYFI